MPWIMIFLVVVISSGCTQTARYKALNFFFTGVPSPTQEIEQEQTNSAMIAARLKNGKQQQNQKSVPKVNHYLHGPYAAGWCGACHNNSSSQVFKSSNTTKSQTSIFSSQLPQKRLAMPLTELCVSCHDDKRPAIAQKAGLWQHGPVATGLCTACHDPHKSANQYMLKSKASETLCTNCHSKADLHLSANPKASENQACTDCHNAHLGHTSYLLKIEFDERNWQGLLK